MKDKYAYILGGGGGKIGFSAGVVYNLYKKGIVPDVVSGISSGNLVGAMAATGQYEQMKEILNIITDNNVRKKRGIFDYAVKFGLHKIGIVKPFFGLWDNAPLRGLLERHLLNREMLCNFYTGVVDIEKDVFINWQIPKGSTIDEEDINYILASTVIPFVFPPVKHKDRLLVDGGVHFNAPFKPVRSLLRKRNYNVNKIIAVSMKEAYGKKELHIKDDADMLPVLVEGILSRTAESDIEKFQLINEVAKKFGNFKINGKEYKYYPGRVFRPMRKLAPSKTFHHKYIKPDFIHGIKVSDSYKP